MFLFIFEFIIKYVLIINVLKTISKKLVCEYTGLPSKVTFKFDIESVNNGTKIVIPISIKCEYRDMVSQRISEEGFFCNCEREIKRAIEEEINIPKT